MGPCCKHEGMHSSHQIRHCLKVKAYTNLSSTDKEVPSSREQHLSTIGCEIQRANARWSSLLRVMSYLSEMPKGGAMICRGASSSFFQWKIRQRSCAMAWDTLKSLHLLEQWSASSQAACSLKT